ncbi:MAG: hypothetical protein HYY01_01170 [Chloroflexi bacterium]|nr:hypothetical protein [Chloroflexota bacterium]
MVRAKTTAKKATRDALHRLVDQLPDGELQAAQRFLAYLRDMGDPVLRAFLEAPEDDEPETEEERLAVEQAKEEIRQGKGIPWEEVKRELDGV